MVYLKNRNTLCPPGSSFAVVDWRRQLRGLCLRHVSYFLSYHGHINLSKVSCYK